MTRPAETLEFHTRLLRLPLAVEESRAYWQHADPLKPAAGRCEEAFQERWFGSKSLDRVRYLLMNFSYRFDAFPEALAVLSEWISRDLSTRQVICHWHLQLTDPLYREFTGVFLVRRRQNPEPTIDRDVVVRWLDQRLEGKWASSTTIRMANALLTCTSEAGLCDARPGLKPLRYPRVSDEALAYLLYLLRGTNFEGAILDNPYFSSLGLIEGFLEQRLRRLPGVTYHRMQQLQDLSWQCPDLSAWARECLQPNVEPLSR